MKEIQKQMIQYIHKTAKKTLNIITVSAFIIQWKSCTVYSILRHLEQTGHLMFLSWGSSKNIPQVINTSSLSNRVSAGSDCCDIRTRPAPQTLCDQPKSEVTLTAHRLIPGRTDGLVWHLRSSNFYSTGKLNIEMSGYWRASESNQQEYRQQCNSSNFCD